MENSNIKKSSIIVCVRTVAKNAYQLRHFCQSECFREAPTGQVSVKFDQLIRNRQTQQIIGYRLQGVLYKIQQDDKFRST